MGGAGLRRPLEFRFGPNGQAAWSVWVADGVLSSEAIDTDEVEVDVLVGCLAHGPFFVLGAKEGGGGLGGVDGALGGAGGSVGLVGGEEGGFIGGEDFRVSGRAEDAEAFGGHAGVEEDGPLVASVVAENDAAYAHAVDT